MSLLALLLIHQRAAGAGFSGGGSGTLQDGAGNYLSDAAGNTL